MIVGVGSVIDQCLSNFKYWKKNKEDAGGLMLVVVWNKLFCYSLS
jgi:hypothetical protein